MGERELEWGSPHSSSPPFPWATSVGQRELKWGSIHSSNLSFPSATSVAQRELERVSIHSYSPPFQWATGVGQWELRSIHSYSPSFPLATSVGEWGLEYGSIHSNYQSNNVVGCDWPLLLVLIINQMLLLVGLVGFRSLMVVCFLLWLSVHGCIDNLPNIVVGCRLLVVVKRCWLYWWSKL